MPTFNNGDEKMTRSTNDTVTPRCETCCAGLRPQSRKSLLHYTREMIRRESGSRRFGALGLAALAIIGCGNSPTLATYEGEDRVESFMQADFTRLYRIHVPTRAEAGPVAPLVLAFHGSGQTGEQLRAQSGLDQAADAAGFIVVYLQAAMGGWDVFGSFQFLGLDEVAYVREVIRRVDQAHVIDQGRIIAVGLSNGGVLAQQLGCTMTDRLAGFVAVAASMPRLLAENCRPSRPISAHYILGTADPFFPVAGNGALLPVDSMMQFWRRSNGCTRQRFRWTLPDLDGDSTTVYRIWGLPCSGGARTELDSIIGGGHAWPGGVVPAPASFGPTSRDISVNEEIANFLERIPRR